MHIRYLLVLAVALAASLLGCAVDKPQPGARELTALQPFSVEVVYVTSKTVEVYPPSIESTNGGNEYLMATGGAVGGIAAAFMSGRETPAYKELKAALDSGLERVTDLHFSAGMLADTQAVVARSAWLATAKTQIISRDDMADITATSLTKLTSSDVVIVFDGWTQMTPDASALDQIMKITIYTRDQHHQLIEYKRHLFPARSDSPIKPVSVFQQDTKEWTKIIPVTPAGYMQNWFADDGAILKKAFTADDQEVIGELDAYLNGG